MQQSSTSASACTCDMSDEDKAKWILNYCRAMTQTRRTHRQRSVEMVGEYQEFDVQNARVEVVDLFTF